MVDIVQRKLGTDLFRGVRYCVAGLTSAWRSYQHVLVTLIMEKCFGK